MAYPAASDAITYCGITDTDHATMVGDMVNWAIQIVESTTGRVFAAASSDVETHYYDAEICVEGQTLYLGNDDLLSVSVDTDGNLEINPGDSEDVKSSDVIYLPVNSTPYNAIKLRGGSGLTWTWVDDPDDAISIKGVFAYSSTPPNDIWYAILRLVKWIYEQRVSDNDIDRPLLTDSGAVIMPQRLPQDVMSLLLKYKKIRIGAPL